MIHMHTYCNYTVHIHRNSVELEQLIYLFLTCSCSWKFSRDLCSLFVCSVSLPHSFHLNPVSGARLEGGQSVGGVTVGRLGDIDEAILGGVGHSEGVALGVAG